MKKLLIAAAVAAMTAGSFADLCSDEAEGCTLYNFKATLNTLLPKAVKYGKSTTCDEDMGSCWYFEKGKRTLQGVLFACEEVCSLEEMGFVLWEPKYKQVYAPLVFNADYGEFENALSTDDAILERFGKKTDKVQMLAELEDAQGVLRYATDNEYDGTLLNMVFAGMGSFDTKNNRIKSVSGNAVATFEDSTTELNAFGYNCDTCYAVVWGLCDWFDKSVDVVCDGIDYTQAVGYGTWSLKYNKKASNGSKSIFSYVPSYTYAK